MSFINLKHDERFGSLFNEVLMPNNQVVSPSLVLYLTYNPLPRL